MIGQLGKGGTTGIFSKETLLSVRMKIADDFCHIWLYVPHFLIHSITIKYMLVL